MPNPPDPLLDLTRWNRAGLQRFRYIDGNAITYLETAREKLADAFPQWEDIHTSIAEDETQPEKLARLQEQYFGPRRDWAWEIARSFVRANHILTEHVNAFANEGFLNTATQWEYLRRLVDMLDYRPRPPGSAATVIALIAKADTAPNIVKKGLQTSHTPDDERPKLVFESLEDIEVDPALNAIRLKDWDHNPKKFDQGPFAPLASKPYWELPKKHEISTGQTGILLHKDDARAVKVSALNDTHLQIESAETGAADTSYILGDTKLLVEPDNVYASALNGPDVMRLPGADSFAAGQIIAWKKGAQIGFARISAADRFGIKLTDINPTNTDLATGSIDVLKTTSISRAQFKANSQWRLTRKTGRALHVIGTHANGRLKDNLNTNPKLKPENALGSPVHTHDVLTGVTGHDLHMVDTNDLSVLARSRVVPARTRLDFEGGAGQITSGDYFVAESSEGNRAAILAKQVLEHEDNFTLIVDPIPDTLENVERLYGPYKHRLSPIGHNRDPRSVMADNLQLDLDPTALPAGLVSGKTVIVEPEDKDSRAVAFKAMVTDIVTVDGDGALLSAPRLVLSLPEAAFAKYSIGAVIIRGNSVKFGHGESKPFTILGSGDASQISQKFVLKKENISFLADSTLESGVRADLRILVDGRRYEEVSTLASSEATDAHYSLRMTEDGFVEITFGDGRQGRRLPTGRNNIVAYYRIGTGDDGNNIAPFGFEKLTKPHKLVDTIMQPLPTAGGQNIESLEQIRTNAPSYLKSLGRSISLADFEHIAKSTPGIWHAKAFSVPSIFSRYENIELTIVPAGNAALGDLKASLEARLTELSPPHMIFTVSAFDPVPLILSLTLQIDSFAYDPDAVEVDVRSALFERLSLQHRIPGEPLFNSQIYKIVEGVRGVSNSTSKLFGGTVEPLQSREGKDLEPSSRDDAGMIWAVRPTDRQVVFLRSESSIAITVEEASI